VPNRKNSSIRSGRPSASCGGIFDWDTAQSRLAEFNKRAEDPRLWNDPRAAQKIMRQRQQLERSINAYKKLERELDDSVTLIELGEAEDDDASVAEGEAQLRKLDDEAQRRGVDRVEAAGAVGPHVHEPALPQHPEVLRHRRLRDPELGLDRLRDRPRGCLALEQEFEDAPAHRVAEDVERVHQLPV